MLLGGDCAWSPHLRFQAREKDPNELERAACLLLSPKVISKQDLPPLQRSPVGPNRVATNMQTWPV